MTTALVVGRFQPFHRGHAALVDAALSDCEQVVVAIGSSQKADTFDNPFSFLERDAMVRAMYGDRVRVVAVPDLDDPPRWVAHVERIVGPFDMVYGNDDATLDLFRSEGHAVARPGLVQRHRFEASRVRQQMAAGDGQWKDALPGPVAAWLAKTQAEERLRRMR